ncbi:response regulator transcription factor [Lachnospiraceae bacterium NSJ-143]|nr:response regulator transcription factor [Lachnospiraceae bacterium NSJ-143]
MAYKILVVDDEKLIVKGIKFSLQQDGMEVEAAYDGEEALTLIKEKKFDLVVLDVMLPKMNGLEVCQHVRGFSQIPIIMVTAKGEDMDKIMGLEYGADDYIVKPFNILELKARIKAILRRSVKKVDINEPAKSNTLEAKGLKIDFDSRRVFINGRETNLTAKEFDMLVLFMENPGKVYSRETLLDTIWGYDYPGDARTVDVHVRRLREKIEEKPSEPKYIYTKWGVGYYFG